MENNNKISPEIKSLINNLNARDDGYNYYYVNNKIISISYYEQMKIDGFIALLRMGENL